MQLILFDMDGVLLKPEGYHRALQESVRLAGDSIGNPNIHLSVDQIAQFEALGISNEWHSSALCMAVMMINRQKSEGNIDHGTKDEIYALDLKDLFSAISRQQVEEDPLKRAITAIQFLVNSAGVPPHPAVDFVINCESIDDSATMNWFQELVLGSQDYEKAYHKQSQFQTDSYLIKFDQKLLSEENTSKILHWVQTPGCGAAIMTNRPSNTLLGEASTPDAEIGAVLVGLSKLPMVANGEMAWLSNNTSVRARNPVKPAWQHALVAILVASGWPVKESLQQVRQPGEAWHSEQMLHLQGCRVTVLEDTPGGIIALDHAAAKIRGVGIEIKVNKIGISHNSQKEKALLTQGATVYSDVNRALAGMKLF